ncbi:MAG TPA: efflux transporter outer membrane subunit [Steroidobacteraceae bacterium]|jgi:NodT family efflux transporter outer membrane factor (OMF) lipoprotein
MSASNGSQAALRHSRARVVAHGALFVALGALLTACTVGPNFRPPDPPTAQTYVGPTDAPAPADQKIALGERIEGDWWSQFHSPALDQLIRQALEGNQDVVAARSRVDQAKEEVNAAHGALLPQVDFGTTAGRQKYGAALFGPLDFTIPPFTYYIVGPTVKAPLDLFGGGKRVVEQKAAYASYQASELEAAYLSLTANVVLQVLSVAEARDQIQVVEGIISDDQRNADLVQKALDDGSATKTQLFSARSQLAMDRTLLPELHQQESTARHALAILVGRSPSEWAPPPIALTDFVLPQEIPATLPSELVHRRPDITAAEAQLHGASAAIGVATANLYPQVDLTGSLTQQALTPGALFNGVSLAWATAASLTQPLFNGGRLKAQQRAAIDGYQSALASYRQVVLRSFGEVADRMQALSNDADQFHAQREAAEAAQSARDLVRRSFAVGNSGVLDVLDAERSTAQAQLGLSRARALRLLDSARLYVALGGSPVGAQPAR